MEKNQIKQLAHYLDRLTNSVPNGLSHLKDALTFATLELLIYCRTGNKGKALEKALTFAQSIPKFDDFKSDECCGWMLHDEEHLKYWPAY